MPDALSPSTPLPVKPANVRMADHRDEGEIYSLLIDMHRENQSGWGFPYRPELVLARIETGTRPDPRTRSNPQDQRRGVIGVIGPVGGPLLASAGIFFEPIMWFSDFPGAVELWLYVRKEARGTGQHERDLFAFALWVHARMKSDLDPSYKVPFPMQTGFYHRGKRFDAMERLWRRFSGGAKCGVLFVRD